MGPSVWGKGSLVSLLLPALRQWVHDLGRENQVRSPAGSWLKDLQQPGSLCSTAGQGYKACTSSLHPSAHPPALKCTTPVHPNAHLSASRCSFPLHPDAHLHFIPTDIPTSSQCMFPVHPNARPHSIPLHPAAHPPCVPVPSPTQPRALAAPWRAGVLRQPVSTAWLRAPCAARYIAEPVKIISACACVVCSNAPA